MYKANQYIAGKKRFFLRRNLQGSISIEMSYIVPFVLVIFLLIIYTVFYFHDKNILIGAAGETAVVYTQLQRQKEEDTVDLRDFYRGRVEDKLLFLYLTNIEVVKTDKGVIVTARAGKGRFKVHIVKKTGIIEPEKQIRIKRQLETLAGKEQ